MDTSYLDQYDSDNDTQENFKKSILKAKSSKYRLRNWIKDQVFKSKEEAMSAIKSENIWSYYYTNVTNEGKKTYFRCNKSKFRGEQCDASVYLLFNAGSEDVVLFRAVSEHTHHKNASKLELSELIKEEINKLLELNQKPKAILQILYEKDLAVPDMTQLRNYISKYKNIKFGRSKISLGELEQWCLDFNTVPESDDSPFIVSYQIIYDDDEDIYSDEEDSNCKFRIFISTKRLLQMASKVTILHADATYKLVWQGFPILVIGTSDYDRHFHIIGLALCTNEKTADFKFLFKSINIGLDMIKQPKMKPEVLISDASDAIGNAFKDEFGEKIIIMCWAHMRRNIAKKVECMVEKDKQTDIIEDIETLQIVQNDAIFEKAVPLFIKKWKHKEPDFINYFDNQWLKKHKNWYEGMKFLFNKLLII